MTNEINEIRQILMNELGLTREMIRAETVLIIEKTVENHFVALVQSGKFRQITVDAIDAYMKGHAQNYRDASLNQIVQSEAAKAAREWVERHLVISVVEL